jgi:hypothetical protein
MPTQQSSLTPALLPISQTAIRGAVGRALKGSDHSGWASKHVRDRAWKPSLPVLHLAFAFAVCHANRVRASKGYSQAGEWSIPGLLMRPETWLADAIENAESCLAAFQILDYPHHNFSCIAIQLTPEDCSRGQNLGPP